MWEHVSLLAGEDDGGMFSLVQGASVGPHHRGLCRPVWSPGTEMLELICIGKNGGKKSTFCVESRFFQPDSGRASCIQHSLSSVPGEVMEKGVSHPRCTSEFDFASTSEFDFASPSSREHPRVPRARPSPSPNIPPSPGEALCETCVIN